MSVRAMTWAWEQDLKPGAKLVLVALADHSDNDGVCWPGQAHIAEKCGLSRQTVSQQLDQLEAAGLLHSETIREHGKVAGKRYFLHLPDDPSRAKSKPRKGSAAPESMSGNPTQKTPSCVGKPDTELCRVFQASVSGNPTRHIYAGTVNEPPTSPLPPQGGGELFGDDQPTTTNAEIVAWFETRFWSRFPEKSSKAKALAELQRMKPEAATLKAIDDGLTYRLSVEAALRRVPGSFIARWPHPHRWLRDRRWTDRPEMPRDAAAAAVRDTRCSFRFSDGERCGAPGVGSRDGRTYHCAAHRPED